MNAFYRRWASNYTFTRCVIFNILFFLMFIGGHFVSAEVIIGGVSSGDNPNCQTTISGNSKITSCVFKGTTADSPPNLSGLIVSCPTTVTCEDGKCAITGQSCNTTFSNQVVVNGKTYTLSIVNDGGACTITNNEVYGCTSSNKVTMPPTNCYAYTDSISAFGKTYYFDKINCVPVVAFTMSSTEDSEGSLIVNVDASPSNNDGDIVNYEWTTSTGQNATGKTASLVFNEAGTHTITLKITDDEGKTASLQTTLVVNLNSPPQALFTTSVTEGTIPLTVNLDASTSNDDDSITDHAWLTSTGQIASGQTATVTFNDVGTHTITLTVTDNLGKTASLEKTVVATQKLIRLVAASYPTDLKVGQSFDLTLQFIPDTTQPADGIQVYLEFDPNKLQVNQVINSGILDFELVNDIGANFINFAAGSFFNTVPLAPFDLVTINFTALQATGDIGTFLHFDSEQSNVTHLGEFLPQQYEDIKLIVGETVALPKCKVNLQGRPIAPDVSWETELKLYFGDNLYTVNTDNFGHCELPSAISLGDHSLCIKNLHTLANRVGPPLALGGSGMLDFGTLVEGDVNDDNKINLLDMSELIKLTNGQKDYHKQADLNADSQIDIADPNLLKSNFNKPKSEDAGFCQWDSGTYRKGMREAGVRDGNRDSSVNLNTSPIPIDLPVGSHFSMDILVQADNSQIVDTAAVYLSFDASKLQVNRLIHGSYLDFWLLNEFDNNQGQISYAAGLWDNQPIAGSFTLVTVEFTVLVASGEQTLSFDRTAPRETDVASAGKSVLGTVHFELAKSKVLCQLYAVHDQKRSDSQLFTVNPSDYQINTLGPLYKGYDIEAIAVHPETNRVYAVSGKDVAKNQPRGHLYAVDGQNGELFPIGSTGFKEIEDLAFGNDGTLWAWAKGDGMITIDLATGTGTLVIPSKVKIEGLTLSKNTDHTVFYGSVGKELWVYDLTANQLNVACDNFPGEVEALEMLPDGILLIGIHEDKGFSLQAFDVDNCQVIPDFSIPTGSFDDVEGIAFPVEACAK